MTGWKKLVKKILCPPLWLTCVLIVLSAVSLTAVFLKGLEDAPAAGVVYALSFYTLCTITVFCVKTLPRYCRIVRRKVYENKYGGRYMTDAAFRIHVSLYLSFAVNILYAATNLFSGIWYGSFWFVFLALYYTTLAVMRFLLLRFVNRFGIGKDIVRELRRSRLCGIILININLVLSGTVLMMISQNRGYEYNGMLIYVMAMYTFYVAIHTAVDVVKFRRYNSPIMSTAKAISLAAALVSMLSLETAMLSQFGTESPPEFRGIMIASTGAGVSVVVLAMSVYMIVRAGVEIKKSRINNSQT